MFVQAILRKTAARAGLLLAALGALAFGVPAGAETAVGAPRPAIWLLADEDTKIYLFGTVHVLPPDLVWRSPEIDRIIEEADELVMEIDESDIDETTVAMFERMMLGKTVPLESRVSPERRAPLREMMALASLPPDSFDGLHTWAAALTLAMSATAQSQAPGGKGGAAGQSAPMRGVEDVLTDEFQRRQRPTFGVETPEQHAGVFSALPQSVQRAMLEEMIDAYVSGQAPMDPEERDWLSGDVEAIGASMEALPPELFAAVLTHRNRAWTAWLIERLERPGTVLFAVGAGHLAGRDSVQSMLQGRGLTVTRIN